MSKRYILDKKNCIKHISYIPETVLADFQRPRFSLVGSEFSVSVLAADINGGVSTVTSVDRKEFKK